MQILIPAFWALVAVLVVHIAGDLIGQSPSLVELIILWAILNHHWGQKWSDDDLV